MKNTDLLIGIGIIIDDEVDDKKANVNDLLRQINENKIPYITYKSLPDLDLVHHFKEISFILLDWRIKPEELSGDDIQQVRLSDDYYKSLEQENIEFLKEIKETTFVPVFIFTNEDKDKVISVLKENDLYVDDKPNFIFVENKNDLVGEQKFFTAVENWILNNPSVYVLKQWNKEYQLAKNHMFWDFYERSPMWPKIFWECYKTDEANMSRELSEIIIRNLYTRIPQFSFEESYLETTATIQTDSSEVRDVLEGERFIKAQYLNSDDVFTGDVFREERTEDGVTKFTYWINIRAQCDLIRNSNPDLYCLKGRVVNEDETLRERFINGEFLERKNNVIISCIDNGKIVEVLFYDLKIKKWNAIKEKRIGRLLPPYITRIQQLYSIYFQRQGLPRNPSEAFPEITQEVENDENLSNNM